MGNQQKKMQWAQAQRSDFVMRKIHQDSDRLAAFKEVQQQQRLAIATIQKQVRARRMCSESLSSTHIVTHSSSQQEVNK